ncbi:hypothetical protein FVR03_02445 [Pontibacter qinzhouensis]|uniref:Outer membrane beta-barrel protein n=2 Tax=Pontibacter qinzhouensis TaxID=2603253 RepID=A0A5C8KAD9_9BACT|nr:hypothetical protein FVR03_02445 [Pontibacter qinzhouensis]
MGAASVGQAQVYRTAAGIRLDGERLGLTIQQRVFEKSTIEGIFAVGTREVSATALYEWHRPILGRRLNYYLGAGAHVGNLKDSGAFTGLDAILGLEYKVNGLPILISTDIKPAFHVNHEDWVALSTGISIRYVILAEKKKKKSLWPFGNKEEDTKSKSKKKQQVEEKPGVLDIFKKKEPPKEEKKKGLRGIFKKEEPPKVEEKPTFRDIFKKKED